MLDTEWAKIIFLLGGVAVGYGHLKARVSTLRKDVDGLKDDTSEKITSLEGRVNTTDKLLEGIRSDVSNLVSRNDRMEQKIDRLLERKA